MKSNMGSHTGHQTIRRSNQAALPDTKAPGKRSKIV